jgi:hypothetical protein
MEKNPELVLQLKQAPNARERALLLDIDYSANVATSWRLRLATAAITAGYLVVMAFTMLYLGASGKSFLVSELVDGAFAAAAVAIVALLVGGIAIQLLSSTAMPPLRQQYIADGLQVAAGPLALVVALALLPDVSRVVCVVLYPPLAGLFGLLGVQQLPLAIALNDRNLLRVVQVTRTLPPELTLLGGRARWLVAYFALCLAEVLGISLLLAVSPLWAIAAVPLRTGLALAGLRALWSGGARAGVVYNGVAAAVFLIAGLTAAAIA